MSISGLKLKSRNKLIATLLVFITFLIFLKFSAENQKCWDFNEEFGVILMDFEILEKFDENHCVPRNFHRKIEIAIDVKYQNLIPEYFPENFEILFYSNQEARDYYEFQNKNLMPKSIFTAENRQNHLKIAKNLELFKKTWRFSRFRECRNMKITRTTAPYPNSVYFPQVMREFRDIFVEKFGILPILESGTLLGWYRECGIIPHTKDIDFIARKSDLPKDFMKKFAKFGNFTIARRLGTIEEPLIISFYANKKVGIDLWILYEPKTGPGPYIAIAAQQKLKNKPVTPSIYKFQYMSSIIASFPLEFCSADLFGAIFWVPCNSLDVLRQEYGDFWYKDHLSKDYVWYKDAKNIFEIQKIRENAKDYFYNV